MICHNTDARRVKGMGSSSDSGSKRARRVPVVAAFEEEYENYEEYDDDRGSGFLSFIYFRTLITPTIIRVIYVAGVLLIIIFGLLVIGAAALQSRRPDSNFLVQFLLSIGIILVGNVLWRVICEGIILFYNIHDILLSIEWELRNQR